MSCMKELYLEPEMEVLHFGNEDVITTSLIEDELPVIPVDQG